jgi:hypothetical protein
MPGAETWHVPRLPFDERCGVRSDPKGSTGATTVNHHEAGEQRLERGAAWFSVPAWILRSRANRVLREHRESAFLRALDLPVYARNNLDARS